MSPPCQKSSISDDVYPIRTRAKTCAVIAALCLEYVEARQKSELIVTASAHRDGFEIQPGLRDLNGELAAHPLLSSSDSAVYPRCGRLNCRPLYLVLESDCVSTLRQEGRFRFYKTTDEFRVHHIPQLAGSNACEGLGGESAIPSNYVYVTSRLCFTMRHVNLAKLLAITRRWSTLRLPTAPCQECLA
jgi:hypothetical protein